MLRRHAASTRRVDRGVVGGVDATQHAEGDEALEQQGAVHLGERRHLLVRGLGVSDRHVRGRSGGFREVNSSILQLLRCTSVAAEKRLCCSRER